MARALKEDEMDSFSRRRDLGRTFLEIDRLQMTGLETAGDGNCLFHACMGDVVNGKYMCGTAMVLRTKWADFMSTFSCAADPRMPPLLLELMRNLFQLFLDKKRVPEQMLNSEHVQQLLIKVSEIHDVTLATSRAGIIDIINALKDEPREKHEYLLSYLVQRAKEQLERMDSPQPKMKAFVDGDGGTDYDSEWFKNLVLANLADCLSALYVLPVDEARARYRTDLQVEMVLRDEAFYRIYCEEIRSQSYYVFVEEVPIIASVLGLNVFLNYTLPGGSTPQVVTFECDDSIWKAANQNQVCRTIDVDVFHRGIHFERGVLRDQAQARNNGPVLNVSSRSAASGKTSEPGKEGSIAGDGRKGPIGEASKHTFRGKANDTFQHQGDIAGLQRTTSTYDEGKVPVYYAKVERSESILRATMSGKEIYAHCARGNAFTSPIFLKCLSSWQLIPNDDSLIDVHGELLVLERSEQIIGGRNVCSTSVDGFNKGFNFAIHGRVSPFSNLPRTFVGLISDLSGPMSQNLLDLKIFKYQIIQSFGLGGLHHPRIVSRCGELKMTMKDIEKYNVADSRGRLFLIADLTDDKLVELGVLSKFHTPFSIFTQEDDLSVFACAVKPRDKVPFRTILTVHSMQGKLFGHISFREEDACDLFARSRLYRKFGCDSFIEVRFEFRKRQPHFRSVNVKTPLDVIQGLGLGQFFSVEIMMDVLARILDVLERKQDDLEHLEAKMEKENQLLAQELQNLMANGFKLCGQAYFPVVVSSSQANKFRIVFSNKRDNVVQWAMGMSIPNIGPAKLALRLGLLKTPSMPIALPSFKEEKDVGRLIHLRCCQNENFISSTDGCGYISEKFAAKVWGTLREKLGDNFRSFFGYGSDQQEILSLACFDEFRLQNLEELFLYQPSAFQIRHQGRKGMLLRTSNLMEVDVSFRDSMKKFVTPQLEEHDLLEVVNFSCRSSDIQTNPYILAMLLLNSKDRVEMEKALVMIAQEEWKRIASLSLEDLLSLQLQCGDVTGFNLLRLKIDRRISLLGIIQKLAIPLCFPIPKSGLYFGVCDPSLELEVGQIFVWPSQYEQPLSGTIIVGKEPCFERTDIQIFNALSLSSLVNMNVKDVVVFSSKLDANNCWDPSRMAGSDLDGDQFFCIWNDSIISLVNCPAHHPPPEMKHSESCKNSDKDFEKDSDKESHSDKAQSVEIDARSVVNGIGLALFETLLPVGVGQLPFSELEDLHLSYVYGVLEYDDFGMEMDLIGALAAKAVDSLKSGVSLRVSDSLRHVLPAHVLRSLPANIDGSMTVSEALLMMKASQSFVFDWELPTTSVNLSSKGFASELVKLGISAIIPFQGDMLHTGLSIGDEHEFVRYAIRIPHMEREKWDSEILSELGFLDVENLLKLSTFRRIAVVNLLGSRLVLKIINDQTNEKIVVANYLIPTQDLDLTKRKKLAKEAATAPERVWILSPLLPTSVVAVDVESRGEADYFVTTLKTPVSEEYLVEWLERVEKRLLVEIGVKLGDFGLGARMDQPFQFFLHWELFEDDGFLNNYNAGNALEGTVGVLSNRLYWWEDTLTASVFLYLRTVLESYSKHTSIYHPIRDKFQSLLLQKKESFAPLSISGHPRDFLGSIMEYYEYSKDHFLVDLRCLLHKKLSFTKFATKFFHHTADELIFFLVASNRKEGLGSPFIAALTNFKCWEGNTCSAFPGVDTCIWGFNKSAFWSIKQPK